MGPNVSEVMDDDYDDVEFSDDQEAALLVALLRWRGPDFSPEAA